MTSHSNEREKRPRSIREAVEMAERLEFHVEGEYDSYRIPLNREDAIRMVEGENRHWIVRYDVGNAVAIMAVQDRNQTDLVITNYRQHEGMDLLIRRDRNYQYEVINHGKYVGRLNGSYWAAIEELETLNRQSDFFDYIKDSLDRGHQLHMTTEG